MKSHRISAPRLASYMGVHPQTIRNLWKRDRIPILHRIALGAYLYGIPPLGGTGSSMGSLPSVPLGGTGSEPKKSDERARSKKVPRPPKKNVVVGEESSQPPPRDLWKSLI